MNIVMGDVYQDEELEKEAKKAANFLRNYYDTWVARAASAVQMSSIDVRDECMDIQANLSITVLSPILGGPAILAGLSSERAQKNLWRYGMSLDSSGSLDFKKIAMLMFRDDVIEELDMRAQDEAMTGQRS